MKKTNEALDRFLTGMINEDHDMAGNAVHEIFVAKMKKLIEKKEDEDEDFEEMEDDEDEDEDDEEEDDEKEEDKEEKDDDDKDDRDIEIHIDQVKGSHKVAEDEEKSKKSRKKK